jgi:predicted AlkP superfamily pyrophosphatase or phosphodiesterase
MVDIECFRYYDWQNLIYETRRRMELQPLVLINAVGLTGRLLPFAPRLSQLAQSGWVRPLLEVTPAVTCTAQASLLTGTLPQEHGIVGNGWLFRDTGEIRFWQQSNRLLQAEPLYVTAQRRARECGRSFRTAQLFWWFNQGAPLDISVTPKPHYGADGKKVFGITGTPDGLCERLEDELGPFPFSTFWGPNAGLPCTEWIARCGALVLKHLRPELCLVYLPHLDYDPQRFGPSCCDMSRLVRELDSACAPLLDAALAAGATTWVVSEYGHVDVVQPVCLNRALRKAGLLTVRAGPFGEMLDTFNSRAFAVCDHQVAHVYVASADDVPRVHDLVGGLAGVSSVLTGEKRREIGLDHPRAGELVALARPGSWFAYPYWLDDRHAPDFARTVDIHRKPGYDPCELFFDPGLLWPQGRAIRRLIQKQLGFRTLFDVIPLGPELVRGSHGIPAEADSDRPLVIGAGSGPKGAGPLAMSNVKELLLSRLLPE